MYALFAAAVLLAALPEERPPAEPIEASVFTVQEGASHLKIAAKSGSPLLLQEAEREILGGLFYGLALAMAGGALDEGRYKRVYGAYEHVQGVFKDLPYRVIVEPGNGLPPFELTLRRHPWLLLMDALVPGWRAEMIESGARLTPLLN